MYIQVLSVSQPVPAATWQLFAFFSATLPLHRRMQIENLNKTLWPGVQNKLKERRWTEEFVLAVGLAKTPQWSSLAVWWQGKLWLWQTEKVLLLLLYNFSTKSTTQRKKKIKPIHLAIVEDDSISPILWKIQFKWCLKKKEQRPSMWKSIILGCLPVILYVNQRK